MIFFLFLAVMLPGIILLWHEKLSSYTIKYLVVYSLHTLWYLLCIVLDVGGFDFYCAEEKIEFLAFFLVYPLYIYLLFPFVWKFLKRWKVCVKMEMWIDRLYNKLKNYYNHDEHIQRY